MTGIYYSYSIWRTQKESEIYKSRLGVVGWGFNGVDKRDEIDSISRDEVDMIGL